jgi:hypothetical protein
MSIHCGMACGVFFFFFFFFFFSLSLTQDPFVGFCAHRPRTGRTPAATTPKPSSSAASSGPSWVAGVLPGPRRQTAHVPYSTPRAAQASAAMPAQTAGASHGAPYSSPAVAFVPAVAVHTSPVLLPTASTPAAVTAAPSTAGGLAGIAEYMSDED